MLADTAVDRFQVAPGGAGSNSSLPSLCRRMRDLWLAETKEIRPKPIAHVTLSPAGCEAKGGISAPIARMIDSQASSHKRLRPGGHLSQGAPKSTIRKVLEETFAAKRPRQQGAKFEAQFLIILIFVCYDLPPTHFGDLFSTNAFNPSNVFPLFCNSANSRSNVISTACPTAAVFDPCLKPAYAHITASGLFAAIVAAYLTASLTISACGTALFTSPQVKASCAVILRPVRANSDDLCSPIVRMSRGRAPLIGASPRLPLGVRSRWYLWQLPNRS
jgi:hypothetical protein